MRIRAATAGDSAGVHAIYAPVVRESAVSFEHEVPSPAEVERRIVEGSRHYPWLVAEAADLSLAGFAYATSWRARAAYRWTCEVTVYVAAPFRRRGVARALYLALTEALRERGFVVAYAAVTLPNPPSVALHESLGFVATGVFPKCGFKRDGWHDVGFWRLELGERPATPRELEEAAC